ncbi:MAG: hypothetical protein NW203_12175 [Hyphomonadaceae bacterium]|nr:hypothetical protein [Hyphomonadaceae bacterium]
MITTVEALALGFVNALAIPAQGLALVGLALVAARDGPRQRRVAAIFLALGLCAGLSAIAAGTGETPAALLLAICAIASGVIAAMAIRSPASVVYGLAVVTGVLIGLDSPPRVFSLRLAVAILVATGIGAVAFFILVAEVLAATRGRWRDIGMRIAGSWIAASAILALAARTLR